MIVHGDLVQCATDLVMGKDSPLIEMVAKTGELSMTTCDDVLADARAAARDYLCAAFTYACGGDDDDGG